MYCPSSNEKGLHKAIRHFNKMDATRENAVQSSQIAPSSSLDANSNNSNSISEIPQQLPLMLLAADMTRTTRWSDPSAAATINVRAHPVCVVVPNNNQYPQQQLLVQQTPQQQQLLLFPNAQLPSQSTVPCLVDPATAPVILVGTTPQQLTLPPSSTFPGDMTFPDGTNYFSRAANLPVTAFDPPRVQPLSLSEPSAVGNSWYEINRSGPYIPIMNACETQANRPARSALDNRQATQPTMATSSGPDPPPPHPGSTGTQASTKAEEEEGDDDNDVHADQFASISVTVEVKHRRPYRHESFPAKLHRMLQEAAQYGKTHLVSWILCGSAFEVKHIPEFERDILPNYFRHRHMASFRRQLSMYGFRRANNVGTTIGALVFAHEEFHRDHPERCRSLKRMSELQLKWHQSSP